MAYYVLGTVLVLNETEMAPYLQGLPEIIARHGGEVLDVVEACDVLEGEWPLGALTALIRFPTEVQAKNFWSDSENVAMKSRRDRAARTNVALYRSLMATHKATVPPG